MKTPRPYVALDRDGTIIEERNYLSDPDDVRLIPGAAAAIRTLTALGHDVFIVTNQSAVARGFLDEEGLMRVHLRLDDLLAHEGARLSGIYVCPHLPDAGCDCRKPRRGLIDQASAELGIDPARGFVVGDKACDVDLARVVGATAILVRTGHGTRASQETAARAHHVVPSIAEVVEVVRRSSPRP